MIAKQNLETKRAALTERVGKLAQEKLMGLERIDAIGEEMRQLNLLVQVFDVTLADMEKDETEVERRVLAAETRGASLEDSKEAE